MKLNFRIAHVVSFLLFFSTLHAKISVEYDIVVACDGSGDYTSIQDALNSCRGFMEDEKVIYIKNGVYKEKVVVYSYLTNITLIGESNENTIITYSNYSGQPGIRTFNSYTLQVMGNNITIKNLTIENSAGRVGQAVALHVEGDKFYIENCRLIGNQDTVYAAGQYSRQYYLHCYIEGTTDFIFGAATAIFDSCKIHCKKNSYITAASTPQARKYGYVFRNCKITAAHDIDRVFLGRPWRDYANVVFLYCEMGDFIVPEGWHNWGDENREKTAFYAEYKNSGPGAQTDKRVTWSKILTDDDVKLYLPEIIFKLCDDWDLFINN